MSKLKMMLIRGSRLLDQINLLTEESTYTQLRSNLKFLKTKKRQLSTTDVVFKKSFMIPAVPSNILNIKSTLSAGNKFYNTVVQFSEIKYEDESTNKNITFTGSDNIEYHVKPIELKRKNVKVRCDCLDFHYRFAANNSRDTSLFGNPPPPVVAKTNRKSDNPKKVPGVCKHIIKTIDELKKSGLVR